MFMKLSKHRTFDYTPRRYDPKKEEKESGRKPIRFQHLRSQRKSKSYIWLIFLLGFVMYIIYMLSKISLHF